MVLWITGLSGSGKTTIASNLYDKLKFIHNNVIILDGDIIRNSFQYSWGYTISERLKGAKFVSDLCHLLDKQEITVICATMSLFNDIQQINRERFHKYIEIYLDVDMDILIKRDKKTLYSRALKGLEKNVVGVDLPYDIPKKPELFLKNNFKNEIDVNVNCILDCFKNY